MAVTGPATGKERHFICSCYFSRNFFLHQYRLHITYQSREQLARDYRLILRRKGCNSDDDWRAVVEVVEVELARRRGRAVEHVCRSRAVAERYTRLHPAVYTLSDSFLEPEFLEIVHYCQSPGATDEGLLKLIREEDVPNVFSFPVFTRDFCDRLLEELDNFERSNVPKGRPNTMNNYGILLSEMGFDEHFMDRFRRDYLMPLSRLLFPTWVGGGLDSHRAFVVQYGLGQDLDLSCHFDNAEVTLNVCLGRDFVGGELYFGAMKGESPPHEDLFPAYAHIRGRGILHRARQMHGARPITEGQRYNLIVWMRASSVRNSLCPMCDGPPQLEEQEAFGDGFTCEVEGEGQVSEPCSVT